MLESVFKLGCKPQACNYIEKETLTQVFSCDPSEIFENTFLTEHLRASASEKNTFYSNLWIQIVV